MNRYFYYNVLLLGLINLALFVPHTLIQYRYTGALMSMACAAVSGTVLAILFTHVMKTFPGKGIPEILSLYIPKYASIPFLLVWALTWLSASSLSLNTFSVLINRFFNPDTSSMIVLIVMCLTCMYGATRSLLTIIFVLEIGLIFSAPIILFVFFKAIHNKNMEWDAIRTVIQYWKQMPRIKPFAAASFAFTGYINFFMMNRLLSPNFRLRFRWLIPVICSLALLISFFVPIGIHGTEESANYLYIWSVTSDTLIMTYGFIERVIFVFLLMYLVMTLIFASIGWLMAMEMVKSCLPKAKPDIDPSRTPRSNWIIVSFFAAMTVAYANWISEKENFEITTYWIVIRSGVEIFSVLFLFVLSLFAPKAGKPKAGKKLEQ
ncbi:GerAB/ArcD/ProY family transporter [Paenibacillus rhizovicinus]|uniref:GerAB/ArcD/ProY family transporter n=1 Tax=Paenibacillus rhizovicinus TaxID=2704463 RepID=A0A6C0P1L2_9BACL|nr:GerAB/ArcD/ProY family transporter [Paenibacillus rhizovicinus]QHW30612.1 GerAB/ArcD/ProY family transporter [Paenibacillus rhizovicinus]